MVENKWFRWLARLALVLYVAWLFRPAWWGSVSPFPVISLGELLDTQRVLQWLAAVGRRELWRVVAFTPLGILLAWNLAAFTAARQTKHARANTNPTQPDTPTPTRCPWTGLLALTLALLVATGVARVATAWQSLLFEWLPIWTGCLLGVWIGCQVIQGWRGWVRLGTQLLLLVTAAVLGMGWLGYAMIQESPLDFQPTAVTSAEKRRIIELMRNRERPTATTRYLQLSEHDANLLLAWGLSIGSEGRRGRVTLGERSFTSHVSIDLAPDATRRMFLNVSGAGQLEIDTETIHLDLTQLRIGRLSLPPFMAHWVSQGILAAIRQDAEITDVLKNIEQLTIRPETMELVTRRGFLQRQFQSELVAGIGTRADVVRSTQQYVQQLGSLHQNLPKNRDQQFCQLVEATFELAKKRSAASDPRLENGSAILALAIVLGHPGVERLVGDVMDSATRKQTRRLLGQPTLRGRSDWTRHFWISAAAAVLYGEQISDAVGMLKEELDAGPGGSGFSFADLLADLAGTRFGLLATQDPATASRLQTQLARQCRVDDLFPPADDLPEGLSDEQLTQQYGGVQGRRFEDFVERVKQRLDPLEDFQQAPP